MAKPTIFGANTLLGGADGALDSIDGAELIDKDLAVIVDIDNFYPYQLDDDIAGVESSPLKIAPDDNPGDKRWILKKGVFAGLVSYGNVNVSYGGLSLILGANDNVATRTNETDKVVRVGTYHYTNAEEPTTILYSYCSETINALYIGGGAGTMNTVTRIRFYTAADTTTVTGTIRMTIESDGGIKMLALKSGANQGAAGAAENELWIDTADQTIKVGTAV